MRKAGVWSAQAGEVDGGPAGSAHFRAQRRVLDRVPADVEPCLRCGPRARRERSQMDRAPLTSFVRDGKEQAPCTDERGGGGGGTGREQTDQCGRHACSNTKEGGTRTSISYALRCCTHHHRFYCNIDNQKSCCGPPKMGLARDWFGGRGEGGLTDTYERVQHLRVPTARCVKRERLNSNPSGLALNFSQPIRVVGKCMDPTGANTRARWIRVQTSRGRGRGE